MNAVCLLPKSVHKINITLKWAIVKMSKDYLTKLAYLSKRAYLTTLSKLCVYVTKITTLLRRETIFSQNKCTG